MAHGATESLGAGAEDPVGTLLEAVRRELARAAPPARGLRSREVEEYVGDVVETAFNGDERARIALLARLAHLAAAAAARGPSGAADPLSWVRRLERLLRGWDAQRRRAVAQRRPDQADVELRLVALCRACDGEPLLPLDVVALELAELTAVHMLSGEQAVETALAVIDELTPLLDLGRHELFVEDDAPRNSFREPGATLAQIEHVAWHATRLLRDEPDDDARHWLVRLLVEIAASLLFAGDVYDERDDHDESWLRVRDRAVDAVLVGRLTGRPATVDASLAIDKARAVALALAGHWLDELRGSHDRSDELRGRVLDVSGQCLVAAWAQSRMLVPDA